MKKSAYFLGLFGSVILFFIIVSSLVLNYSSNVVIFNILFSIELAITIVYLFLLNIKYWRKKELDKESNRLFKTLSICSMLILPFNLFSVIFKRDNLLNSVLEFFIIFFRSIPNYIVIIPIAISFYIINKNKNNKRKIE